MRSIFDVDPITIVHLNQIPIPQEILEENPDLGKSYIHKLTEEDITNIVNLCCDNPREYTIQHPERFGDALLVTFGDGNNIVIQDYIIHGSELVFQDRSSRKSIQQFHEYMDQKFGFQYFQDAHKLSSFAVPLEIPIPHVSEIVNSGKDNGSQSKEIRRTTNLIGEHNDITGNNFRREREIQMALRNASTEKVGQENEFENIEEDGHEDI